MTTRRKYRRCAYWAPDVTAQFKEDSFYCSPGAETLEELYKNRQRFDPLFCKDCKQFKSKYVEFPITIENLALENPDPKNISFQPVKVRMCDDEKTYFGILLGDFPYWLNATLSEETSTLNVSATNNPCIILPKEKRVVFGAQCWWQRIQPGEEILDITDEDIDDTWYVKLLKELMDQEKDKEE